MRIVVALGETLSCAEGEPPDAELQRRDVEIAGTQVVPDQRSDRTFPANGLSEIREDGGPREDVGPREKPDWRFCDGRCGEGKVQNR